MDAVSLLVESQNRAEACAPGGIRVHGNGGGIGPDRLAVAGVGRIESQPPAKVAQSSAAEGGEREPLLLVVEQGAQAKASLRDCLAGGDGRAGKATQKVGGHTALVASRLAQKRLGEGPNVTAESSMKTKTVMPARRRAATTTRQTDTQMRGLEVQPNGVD